MAPGPILEYDHEGKTHLYITDFYYQPYNLIIEVKDGGDNPNKRNMPEYRQKQIEKEKYIILERFITGKTQMELAEEIGISQAQISRFAIITPIGTPDLKQNITATGQNSFGLQLNLSF